MKTNIKVIGGFILGAALGTATGLLIAPRSGKKTRRKLKAKSQQAASQLIGKAKDTLEHAKETYNQKVDTYAKNGKSSIDHLSDAIHAK